MRGYAKHGCIWAGEQACIEIPAPLPPTTLHSYVPLVWAATLAYWSEGLLTEAGLVLQVRLSAT